MVVDLHVATNFEMYRQNSEEALWGGGGGNCPPAPPPPPPATLMAGNAKEADIKKIWFGRESAREARGKFKDLVCLVVFLCWIKRFVLLSWCLKCNYMNIYFSSFQNSRGRPPLPPSPRIAAYGLHTLMKLDNWRWISFYIVNNRHKTKPKLFPWHRRKIFRYIEHFVISHLFISSFHCTVSQMPCSFYHMWYGIVHSR